MTSGFQAELFRAQFDRFERLNAPKGQPFKSFLEGRVAADEGYKPLLHDHAFRLLNARSWSESAIGSGTILAASLAAIEVQQNSRSILTNNLVFWQNRFGHANRDHRALLDAKDQPRLRREFESLLFGLYRGNADEGTTFERLSALTAAKYPLLAYLYFLKDMDRFMPIQPTTFDRAFRDLGIDLVTRGHCTWDNYQRFNAALAEVQRALTAAGVSAVRLIDAHSFCYMLKKADELDPGTGHPPRNTAGRFLSGREIAAYDLVQLVQNTVRNSNGQTIQRTVKDKKLLMNPLELERLLVTLLERQSDRCALTGIPFRYRDPTTDPDLTPSVDRIDSSKQYEPDNLQVVCRFINFWKSDTDNEEFRRLLMLVRGQEPDA